MEKQKTAVYLNLCTLIGLIGMGGFIWYGIRHQLFVSADALKAFLSQFGLFAPALFIVIQMVGEKNYEKYIGWLEKGKAFDKAFAVAIFLPVAPDDLLCYIAGLTPMSLKKFAAIIFLGKPGSIFLYSLGLTGIMGVLRYLF